uniref:Uncharacterized protein n=1 Tax=Romanomermis culicivorax TaxID=13658 RepID=A0A915KHS8_ROMCU
MFALESLKAESAEAPKKWAILKYTQYTVTTIIDIEFNGLYNGKQLKYLSHLWDQGLGRLIKGLGAEVYHQICPRHWRRCQGI